MTVDEGVIYREENKDSYLIVRTSGDVLIVHSNYFSYESAILFTVGHPDTDWSDTMILDDAKRVVDLLNKEGEG